MATVRLLSAPNNDLQTGRGMVHGIAQAQAATDVPGLSALGIYSDSGVRLPLLCQLLYGAAVWRDRWGSTEGQCPPWLLLGVDAGWSDAKQLLVALSLAASSQGWHARKG